LEGVLWELNKNRKSALRLKREGTLKDTSLIGDHQRVRIGEY
jgi:hypothetical protein